MDRREFRLGIVASVVEITDKQFETFHQLIEILDDTFGIDQYHHSDSVGGDKEIHDIMTKRFKSVDIHSHPCNKKSLRAFLPSHTNYKIQKHFARNKKLLETVDFLIGLPSYNNGADKSVWHTINYADKLLIPKVIIFPNGKITYEHWDKQYYRNLNV